jgi:hypothetical protein
MTSPNSEIRFSYGTPVYSGVRSTLEHSGIGIINTPDYSTPSMYSTPTTEYLLGVLYVYELPQDSDKLLKAHC